MTKVQELRAEADRLRLEAEKAEAAELLAERLKEADTIPCCPHCGSRVFRIYAFGEAAADWDQDECDGDGDWIPESVGTADHGDANSSAHCVDCDAEITETLAQHGWKFYETTPRGENQKLRDALAALFEHCAMIHKHWGDASNAKEADAAIERAQTLLTSIGGK
jgi:hypothetical protein